MKTTKYEIRKSLEEISRIFLYMKNKTENFSHICCRMKIFKSYGQIMYQIILNNGKMLNKNLQKGGETLSWLQEDQNMKWKICLSND